MKTIPASVSTLIFYLLFYPVYSQDTILSPEQFKRDSALGFKIAMEAYQNQDLSMAEQVVEFKNSLKILDRVSTMTYDSAFWIGYLDIYTSAGAWALVVGDFETTEKYLTKCLQLNQQRFGNKNYIYRIAITKLGALAMERGDYLTYFNNMEKALFFSESNLESYDIYLGHSYSNMSRVYSRVGEYEKAQMYLIKSNQIYESLYQLFQRREEPGNQELLQRYTHTTHYPEKLMNAYLTDIPGFYVMSCLRLLNFNINHGNHLNVEHLVEQVDAVLLDDYISDRWEKRLYRSIEMGRARTLHNLTKYQPSLDIYNRVLESKELDPNEEEQVVFSISDLHFHLGNYEQALANTRKRLAMVNQRLPKYISGKHLLFAQIGLAHAYLNHADSTQIYFSKSLQALDLPAIEILDSTTVSECLANYSSIKIFELLNVLLHITEANSIKNFESRTWDDHIEIIRFTEFVDRICLHIIRKFEYPESIFELVGDLKDTYTAGINSAFWLYTKEKDPQFANLALQWSDHCKGTVLRLKNYKRGLKISNTQESAEERLSYLNLQRDYLKHQFYETAQQGGIDSVFKKNLTDQEIELSLQIDSLNKMLNKPALNPKEFLLDDYKNYSQDKNTTIVDYFLGKEELIIQCIHRDQYQFIRQSLPQEMDDLIASHRTFLVEPKRRDDAFNKLVGPFKETNAKLYELLIQPIQNHLSQQVIIIPHGSINNINFEVLISDINAGDSFRDLAYFGRKHEVSYGYSPSLIASRIAESTKRKYHYIGFAPSYTSHSGPQPGKNSISFVDEFTVDTRSYLGPLKYNTEEVLAAQNIFGGEVFIKDTASEETFLNNGSKADILHLAMHALVNNKNSKYSFIAMEPGDKEDGFVYPYEIYPLKLNADLVVLSGCKTGIGEIKSGEGLISMARAFHQAGANSLVSSLWEVNDRTSKEVIISFFKYLKKGYSKSRSLQKAKQEFLVREIDEHYTHPYYWAGFILMGNPDPLFNKLSAGWIVLISVLFILVLFWSLKKYQVFRRRSRNMNFQKHGS